ncbi:putative bzip transcription factor protein [Eutypa lata UCREL1]|uniref:Putative bzip transcription factor protein n=1 Tax=Eutypa lata (strain UCR-EL1) TaxID=1287681 RepID=M7T9G6_EUTLA|nr:putative bzip transcription factor protein [Eutypa lata UCREL1]
MGLSTQSQSHTNASLATTPESEAFNMTKCTVDSSKSNKRKGTRSVSTLTPSQLARKRANDREAQRAIRARTKEHIENLERQVEELRSQQGRDRVVQELLRRNKALDDELRRLREILGLPSNNAGAGAAGIYHSAASYPGACTRTPPFCPTGPEYQQTMQDGGAHAPYGNMNESGDAWHQASMQDSIPSTVSSPSSRGTDDYGSHNYLPASMPPSMMSRASIPPAMGSVMSSPAPSSMGIKGGYEDIKSEYGMPPVSVVPLTPTFHAQQPWNVYPMYYPGSPATM